MSNIYNKILKDANDKFNNELTEAEIKDILSPLLNEKDSPISTGKRLIIGRVLLQGKKQEDEIINFDESFFKGINMIIASNFKGKSSLFKAIQFALTGSDGLKKDIKKWIQYILVSFKINERCYTIKLDLSSPTFKGNLYNIALEDDIVDIDFKGHEPIFEKKVSKTILKVFRNSFLINFHTMR